MSITDTTPIYRPSADVHYSEQALLAAALAMKLTDEHSVIRVAAAADRLRDVYDQETTQ